jgi:cytoskeleton protein RodZ
MLAAMTKVTHLTVAEGGQLSNRRIHLREITADADAPLETVGQDLRAARLRRGDDIASAARTLKIRKDYLEALEEDRFSALPGRAYAVGFVRAYADYLGLDPLQTVERFKQEIAGRDEQSKTAGFPETREESRLPHGWILIVTIVVALIGYGVYELAMSFGNAPSQPVAAVPGRMMSHDKTAARQARPTPKRTAIAAPTVPGEAQVGANSFQSAVTTNAATASGKVYGLQNANPHIVLRVTQPTRVLVQDSAGKAFINRALEPGDSYRVPNVPGLLLTAQHGNAVEIDLDGQAMGSAGKGGDAAEAFALDPQAIADRYTNGRHH